MAALAKSYKKRGYKVCVLLFSKKSDKAITEDLLTNGIDLFKLKIFKITELLTNIKLLHRILHGNNTIVHTHMWKANLISRFFKVFFDFKLVNTIHAVSEGKILIPLLYRLSQGLPEMVTTVSELAKDNIIAQGISKKEKIKTIPNVLLLNHMAKISENTHGLNKNPYRILFVGRLEKEKNPSILIDAMSILSEYGLDFELNIIGDGSLYQFLKRKVCDSNLGGRINFLGSASPANQYGQSNLLVIPSLSEAFGLVLIEAAFCKLDFVSSKAVPVREILGEKVKQFDPTNASELANLIIDKVKHPADTAKIENRKHYVSKKYNIDIISKEWDSLYRQLK